MAAVSLMVNGTPGYSPAMVERTQASTKLLTPASENKNHHHPVQSGYSPRNAAHP